MQLFDLIRGGVFTLLLMAVVWVVFNLVVSELVIGHARKTGDVRARYMAVAYKIWGGYTFNPFKLVYSNMLARNEYMVTSMVERLGAPYTKARVKTLVDVLSAAIIQYSIDKAIDLHTLIHFAPENKIRRLDSRLGYAAIYQQIQTLGLARYYTKDNINVPEAIQHLQQILELEGVILTAQTLEFYSYLFEYLSKNELGDAMVNIISSWELMAAHTAISLGTIQTGGLPSDGMELSPAV